jgi:hypothetical protein
MVNVALAVSEALVVDVAVTFTCTLSAVKYGGGVYWPVDETVPAPELASPPETDHVTLGAAPLESEAVNCSTEAFEELFELQPVQLVSIAAAPGVTDRVPPEEFMDEPEVQPASRIMAGKAPSASMRTGPRCDKAVNPRLVDRPERGCSVVSKEFLLT